MLPKIRKNKILVRLFSLIFIIQINLINAQPTGSQQIEKQKQQSQLKAKQLKAKQLKAKQLKAAKLRAMKLKAQAQAKLKSQTQLKSQAQIKAQAQTQTQTQIKAKQLAIAKAKASSAAVKNNNAGTSSSGGAASSSTPPAESAHQAAVANVNSAPSGCQNPVAFSSCSILSSNQTKLVNLLGNVQTAGAKLSGYAAQLSASYLPSASEYAVNTKTGKYEAPLASGVTYKSLDQLFPSQFPSGKFNAFALDGFIGFLKNPTGNYTTAQKNQIKGMITNTDFMYQTIFNYSVKDTAALYANFLSDYNNAQIALMNEINNQDIKKIYNSIAADGTAQYDPTVIDAPFAAPEETSITLGGGLPGSQTMKLITNFNLINIPELLNHIQICIPNAMAANNCGQPQAQNQFPPATIAGLVMSGVIGLVMVAGLVHGVLQGRANAAKAAQKDVKTALEEATPAERANLQANGATISAATPTVALNPSPVTNTIGEALSTEELANLPGLEYEPGSTDIQFPTSEELANMPNLEYAPGATDIQLPSVEDLANTPNLEYEPGATDVPFSEPIPEEFIGV